MTRKQVDPGAYLEALSKARSFMLGSLTADFPGAGFEEVLTVSVEGNIISGIALTSSAIAFDFSHEKGDRPWLHRVRTKAGATASTKTQDEMTKAIASEFPFLKNAEILEFEAVDKGSRAIATLTGMVVIISAAQGMTPWVQRALTHQPGRARDGR